uniref:Uncharacterized protein n=1 Tax=Panagrolaimus sp. PS1159 TaxID=55785 RepID=A0AC35GT55_9BILA
MLLLSSFKLFILFIILQVSLADNLCTKENLDTIENCYLNNIFSKNVDFTPNMASFLDEIKSLKYNKTQWEPWCEIKERLNSCIGTKIVQNCYNQVSLNGSSILNGVSQWDGDNSGPITMIVNFYDMDYTCSQIFNISDTEIACGNSSTYEGGLICPQAENCETFDKRINCISEIVSTNCGKRFGCVYKKRITLSTCTEEDVSSCGICSNLSANLLDSICSNDIFEEPAETTEPTEPAEPAEPAEPTEPAEPAEPTEPVKPDEPMNAGPSLKNFLTFLISTLYVFYLTFVI